MVSHCTCCFPGIIVRKQNWSLVFIQSTKQRDSGNVVNFVNGYGRSADFTSTIIVISHERTGVFLSMGNQFCNYILPNLINTDHVYGWLLCKVMIPSYFL